MTFLPADDEDVRIDTVPPEPRKVSPWTQRAFTRSLPYKVYADLHTDARADVVPATANDILRRSLPPTAEVK